MRHQKKENPSNEMAHMKSSHSITFQRKSSSNGTPFRENIESGVSKQGKLASGIPRIIYMKSPNKVVGRGVEARHTFVVNTFKPCFSGDLCVNGIQVA